MRKRINSTVYGEVRQHYEKSISSVIHIVWCHNAKTHAKHPVRGKETKFAETCLLSVYERTWHKNDKKKKNHGKHPI